MKGQEDEDYNYYYLTIRPLAIKEKRGLGASYRKIP